MELDLIIYTDAEGKKTYHAVNDKHYEAMGACGHGLDESIYGSWDWLGDVQISEEILNEQGYYYKE